MRTISVAAASIVFMAALAAAGQGCGADVQSSSSASGAVSGSGGQPGSSSGSGGAGGSVGPGGSGGVGAGPVSAVSSSSSSSSGAGGCAEIKTCQNHVFECGDGVDNDGDGLVDSDDPECLGPCDNTEGSFHVGIPDGSPVACDNDCYFDPNGGHGDDECYWSHRCDPHEVPPNYDPEFHLGDKCAYDLDADIPGTDKTCAELSAAQSPACMAYCGPLTPNGCDCFGCCELPAGSGKYAWLGSEDGNGNGTCDLAGAADPTKCRPCEPVPACLNACDPCELCIGKSAVAPGCAPADQCPDGLQPCGLPGQGCCPSDHSCITGCCQPNPL
jgi:hypothetical protein